VCVCVCVCVYVCVCWERGKGGLKIPQRQDTRKIQNLIQGVGIYLLWNTKSKIHMLFRALNRMLSNAAKWIYLVHDRRQQRALLISLMSIRVT